MKSGSLGSKSLNNHRSKLFQTAAQAAASIRQSCQVDPFGPVCIYDLCEQLGVTVRFALVSMEGMYDRAPKPRIHLSALRPTGRRAFTCAHELGHHFFQHGTTVDRLIRSSDPGTADNEFLANSFAANLLMPPAGIRAALRVRKIAPNKATPTQMYSLACNFGVGYRTLLRHLFTGMRLLDDEPFMHLHKWTPRLIAEHILGDKSLDTTLRLVDFYWGAATVDVEQEDLLLCPPGTVITGSFLLPIMTGPKFDLYRCAAVGIGNIRLPQDGLGRFVRIQPRRYVGLAKYRHLEEME